MCLQDFYHGTFRRQLEQRIFTFSWNDWLSFLNFRYGKNGVDEYKQNLVHLFDRFKQSLSPDCLVIWNATLPISKNIRGGFLIPEVEFMNSTLRLDILEANFFAQQVVISHGYDLLDLHYYMRNQLHRRAADGVHWDQTAHRRITNLLLCHISGEYWTAKF